MAEKKLGATMTCGQCGNTLHCAWSKEYEGKRNLQWQNEDGTPHYKRISPGKYECRIPDGQTPAPQTTGDTSYQTPQHAEPAVQEANLSLVYEKLDLLKGTMQTLLHEVIDLRKEFNEAQKVNPVEPDEYGDPDDLG
jgi:hypothetical protein